MSVKGAGGRARRVNWMSWEWDEMVGRISYRYRYSIADGYGSQGWRRRRRLDSAPSTQLCPVFTRTKKKLRERLGELLDHAD